jgi:hypothetical protein
MHWETVQAECAVRGIASLKVGDLSCRDRGGVEHDGAEQERGRRDARLFVCARQLLAIVQGFRADRLTKFWK